MVYSSLIDKINSSRNKKLSVCGIFILFAGFLVLLRASFYGTHTWDESFYLTIPYRFFLGDAPFVDEWHVSQLSAFLQYIPLWLFVKIAGSAEGIILYFRILTCLCQFAIAVFMFQKLKKQYPGMLINF